MWSRATGELALGIWLASCELETTGTVSSQQVHVLLDMLSKAKVRRHTIKLLHDSTWLEVWLSLSRSLYKLIWHREAHRNSHKPNVNLIGLGALAP